MLLSSVFGCSCSNFSSSFASPTLVFVSFASAFASVSTSVSASCPVDSVGLGNIIVCADVGVSIGTCTGLNDDDDEEIVDNEEEEEEDEEEKMQEWMGGSNAIDEGLGGEKTKVEIDEGEEEGVEREGVEGEEVEGKKEEE